jgi:hypothetical protein
MPTIITRGAISAKAYGFGVSGGYSVSNSLRFRSSASAYLNRTFATPTSSTVYTWSGWLKRGALGATNYLFGASTTTNFGFNSSNNIVLTLAGTTAVTTTAVYRDPSAWYHIVYAQNGSAQTIYVNGVTAGTGTTANTVFNTTIAHQLGAANTVNFLDGYLAEVNFVDGQALAASSFGTYDTNGVWQPIKYSGTYGTNGFYLPFTNRTSTATLGNDFSGNGNNWTPNNISLTAGSTYDSMVDSPTVGAKSSNYAVLNPLNKDPSQTVSDGNLTYTGSASLYGKVNATFGMSSGKWYWEATLTGGGGPSNATTIGIATAQSPLNLSPGDSGDAYGWGYYSQNGNKYNNGTGTAYGASYAATDVIGVAFDAGAGTLTFYKNNTSQGTAFSSLTNGPYFPSVGDVATTTYPIWAFNFGQQPFSYTPPTGFKALNTYNLPTPTIANGAQYMAATTYTGTGATQTISDGGNNTIGTTFQPDLVWIKSRSAATNNNLFDVLRGTTAYLSSNSTSAEATNANTLTAFGSTGFTVGSDAASIGVNVNAATYVGWQWKANGAGVTNTNGSITSTVSANTTAGFSVVTYTGTGANATVGHGLGVAPSMVIVKLRSSAQDWIVWQTALAGTEYLIFTTAAKATGAIFWNSTTPTSTVFSIGSSGATNTTSGTYVAYCWAAVPGYSAFGSYTGNGSADGSFAYVGFRPRYVLIKRTDSTGDWYIWDTSRNTYNVVGEELLADTSGAGNTATDLDILSNGFKICTTTAAINTSGGTYIYAAFAENPFQNSRAR